MVDGLLAGNLEEPTYNLTQRGSTSEGHCGSRIVWSKILHQRPDQEHGVASTHVLHPGVIHCGRGTQLIAEETPNHSNVPTYDRIPTLSELVSCMLEREVNDSDNKRGRAYMGNVSILAASLSHLVPSCRRKSAVAHQS